MSSRRRRFRARPKAQLKKPRVNREITSPQVRLIGADGEQKGVLSTSEALSLAAESGTDLVIVAETTEPPVARLMDVSKHMYEKRKKFAKQKKTSKTGNVKGLRISFKISEHDQMMRLNQAAKFLRGGNKIKLEMRLRGREKSREYLAEQKMREFVAAIPEGGKIEGKIGRSPRGLSALLTR